MTKRAELAVLLLGLSFACRPADSAVSAADSAAVTHASEQYRQAWLNGDTAAALARVSSDIRILISGVPDIVGAESVRAMFVQEMATYRIPTLTLDRQDLIVRGDHAIDIGRYDEILVPKTGPQMRNRGRYMTIWRRESGAWRIVRFMLNELPAAPAP